MWAALKQNKQELCRGFFSIWAAPTAFLYECVSHPDKASDPEQKPGVFLSPGNRRPEEAAMRWVKGAQMDNVLE